LRPAPRVDSSALNRLPRIAQISPSGGGGGTGFPGWTSMVSGAKPGAST
jgi:hypothetical protein